ncbi:ABC transporter permease [Nostoc sp. 'Peltigera membranacea cyanobiont' 232]|uniref:ABC transporter permease n=1 Tax=Nostoc sp. 'Peltigera membranacea cyanobiont' 232 TaxID=2014531 RepID=UPI000B954F28|nr:ABC-2 family transporter protein [Nostoc sp. 'Peltigera membranacea cyanobiont' 232]OYE05807.1 ABC transporter permease [Nostoc sp. 'Peltigera membranacea cyanobiont' 232]
MKAYWSLFVARFALLLQYRTAALAGVVTQLFWGLVKVMVLQAFFTHTTSAQPITFQQAVGYIWLGQAFLMAIVPWGGDRDIQELIRTGAVGYDLLRPTDLYNFWFTRALALRIAPLILRAIPLLCVTSFIFPIFGLDEWSLSVPPTFASFLAFFLSFIDAIFLSSALTMLLTVSMMWTISGEGINNVLPTLIIVLSGMIVPLPLFPEWSKPFLNALPFSGLIDKPFRLFTGNLQPNALFNILLHQTFWIIIIIILGRVIVKHGIKKLVIQGG